jgi:hypothetical protein
MNDDMTSLPLLQLTAMAKRDSAQMNVTLKVYSSQGSEIVTLVSENRGSGSHSVVFEPGAAVPSGSYYYVLSTEYGERRGRIVLLR